jgi:DNA-binding Lrp family transcriptional regulator
MNDELEKKIVRALNEDARKSLREIAREVDTSVTAVSHKVKKLEEKGAIEGYIPVINAEYFGYNLMAIIALRFSQGKLLETQEKIAKDPRVAAVYDVTGEWDSLVICHFQGREDLNQFIKTMLALRYVDRTVTHIVLNVVKEERRILI